MSDKSTERMEKRKLKNRISAARSRERQRADNAALCADNAALRAENAALRAENAALCADNAALRAENAALCAELTNLREFLGMGGQLPLLRD